MIQIGIIGGSGLYNIEGMKNIKEISVKTPFGNPSDKVITGEIKGVKIGFIARHNREHLLTPTEVPYRANVYALKKLGANTIIAFSAVGSLREKFPPKTLVMPNQLIDKTILRPNTFFGGGLVMHTPFAHPFCNCLQELLYKEAKKLKIKTGKEATLVAMEGPAYSTKAESLFHKKMGWDLIGMTACPEAKLAREASLRFAQVCMVTDFDAWKEGDEVSVSKVNETMKYNEVAAKKLILAAIPLIAKKTFCSACKKEMPDLTASHNKSIDKKVLKKLEVILKQKF
ncbi:MAG: S-methyl-5'-thioadenosine phosphorylase [Elusimicrobiaceae bacterium]|nr:S-methyl-5'-thioadenosine phosphorylase [Elusimicrobiaceae bacterium]